MACRFSASGLLEEITGAKSWHQHFAEREERIEDEFQNEDLFDLMFDSSEEELVEEKVESKSPSKTSTRVIPFPLVDENQCSICFCEFDDVVVELDCAHRFCASCVTQYLSIKINEHTALHHRVAKISRDEDDAVVVDVFNVVGVKCPHYRCLDVINDEKIHKLVDPSTWEKFDTFALDETLEKMQSTGDLQPCPLNCGYFTQDDCLCVNPDCRKRLLAMRVRDEVRRKREEDRSNGRLNFLMAKQPDLFRLCPTCHAQIEKNGGCDHMYCTRCNQNFLWSKALPLKIKCLPHYQFRHANAIKNLSEKK